MPVKILMVCLGNICRSPLAEGILASKLPNKQFVVDSAGTGSWHIGSEPDRRSIAVAKKHGLSISNLRGRQISVEDFDNFDYIYVMDKQNYKDVLQLTTDAKHRNKVKLILNEQFPDKNIEVPDPYFGGDECFEKVFLMLDSVCEIIASKLIYDLR